MIQHHSPISGIAAYKNDYIATAGYDNQVILWDPKTSKALAVGHHDHLANQCEFSSCGRYLISTSSDYTARLWLLPQMRLISVMGDHQDDVEMAIFHPEKEWIATASRDKIVRVFDFQGHLLRRLVGHERDVISVTWFDEDTLFSSSDDGTIRRWNVDTGEQIEILDLGGVETDTLIISQKGTIFAGNDAGEITIISANAINKISAHQAGIKRLCYSKEKNKLVSLSYDRSLIIWGITDNDELIQLMTTQFPNCVWARSCSFLGEDKLVLATFGSCYAVFNYQQQQWNTQQVKETQGMNAITLKGDMLYSIGDAGIFYINHLPHIQLSGLCNFLLPFANTVLTGGQTGEIYNAFTGEVIYQHYSPLNCGTTYRYDGKEYAIIGSYTGEGIVLSMNESNAIYFLTTVKLHDNAIKGIASDEQYIFSICADYNAAFHDIQTLQLVRCFSNAHEKIANACAGFGKNQFVSVSRDLKLRLFSPEEIKTFPTRHTHSIKSIAISSNKQFLASADYHGEVFVYDRNMAIIAQDKPTIAGLSCITPGKSENEFIISSYDGKLYKISFCIDIKEAA
jgi:WD40 repeat protein